MASPEEVKSAVLTDDQREHILDFSKWARETLGENIEGTFSDNDWTFIIKLHAMIETALNASLVKQFDAPELFKVIAKLDTANTATGKVAFAKALKILDPSSVVFIQKLSELRNFCVHDVRNFKFDLTQHLESLTDEKRKELMKPILKSVKEEHRNSVSPREALLIGGMIVMMELHAHHTECRARVAEKKLQRFRAESFVKQTESKPTAE